MADSLELVRSILENLPPTADTAPMVQVAAARALLSHGFDVTVEHVVDGGRIDLVVAWDDWRGAIEIDARRPRARSLLKLRAFSGAKIIALRGVTALLPEGIDAVVNIPVRTALDAERADRRIVSRIRA
jgi:hypothetical protein